MMPVKILKTNEKISHKKHSNLIQNPYEQYDQD